MLRSAFDRRAGIEQDRRPAAGRNDRRQRGPIDARQPPERRVRRHHRRAGVSGAEERVRTADRGPPPPRHESMPAACAAAPRPPAPPSRPTRGHRASRCRAPRRRDAASARHRRPPRAPTSSSPICRCRAATRAPSMMLPGPWSPPMASMAMRIKTASSCQRRQPPRDSSTSAEPERPTPSRRRRLDSAAHQAEGASRLGSQDWSWKLGAGSRLAI